MFFRTSCVIILLYLGASPCEECQQELQKRPAPCEDSCVLIRSLSPRAPLTPQVTRYQLQRALPLLQGQPHRLGLHLDGGYWSYCVTYQQIRVALPGQSALLEVMIFSSCITSNICLC